MNAPDIVDCHSHTLFSDGTSTPEQTVAAAAAAGCTTFAITDHLARPAYMDCFVEEARIPELAARVEALRAQTPALDIVFGFEADWYPGCEADIADARGGATFLLGSVHYLDEYALDWDEDVRIWEGLGADEVWRRYVQAWCEAATSAAGFDTMAHPDLPRVAETFGFAATPALAKAPLWDAMAQAAAASGVHVEVSTAALAKGLGECYPERGLLKRFFAAGVPLTVGADAHDAKHVAYRMRDAYAHAYSVGYRSIDVPCSRGGWRTVSIG